MGSGWMSVLGLRGDVVRRGGRGGEGRRGGGCFEWLVGGKSEAVFRLCVEVLS